MTWEEKRIRNKEILKLLDQGVPLETIANRFKLTLSRVQEICRTGGVVARHSRGDLMVKLRKRGMTYQAIADKFGVSKQAVHNAVKSRTVLNTTVMSRKQKHRQAA